MGVCQIRELSNRSHLASQRNNSLHFYQVKCQGVDDSLQNSISAEPKWKEKLAAVNENSNRMRIQSLQVHEEYKKQQVTLQREKLQVAENSYLLKDLDFIPCLTDEGLIRDISASDAKASVYAVFDETKILQYVGISRQVYMSMRLHFARVPSKCHFVKVQHVKQPNRVLLECIKDKWITENGFVPSGNDNGPQQSIWENPLDCKVLMTDEEKRNLQEAGAGIVEAKILKNVARRIEVQLDAEYKKRNCKETFRFEPKMKEKGLLDLRNKQPDKSVPASVPKPKSAS